MGLSSLPSPPLSPALSSLRWDVFCRVIDNHGDLGVCWRLACDLASRGHHVRLWVDDATALTWMAPAGMPGVALMPWRDLAPGEVPGDVVVEAFGCDPPDTFLQAMAQSPGCVWINLEYLSAEPYVERSHGLASPQFSGPAAGLTKWFFYPGFTGQTGGLLRDPQLADRQARLDRARCLQQWGIDAASARSLVSVFAYPHSPVEPLLALLAREGGTVLACPGAAQSLLLARAAAFPSLQIQPLPWLSQAAYDELLWCCDLNFVRGEDSFVRAQWAGAPWVWQIYAQDDGVHADKLAAFLALHLQGAPAPLADDIGALWRAWNDLGPWPKALPSLHAWQAHAHRWRSALLRQTDLVTALERFVSGRR